MTTIDYSVYYILGNLLGEPLMLPRHAFNYYNHNINSSNLVWKHDKQNHPTILNIRHCINTYLVWMTNCPYSKTPKVHPMENPAWVETGVNYEMQSILFEQFTKKRHLHPEKDITFEDWCQCAIAEFLIKHYPELITPEENHALNSCDKLGELNEIELTPLESSEITQVNIYSIPR